MAQQNFTFTGLKRANHPIKQPNTHLWDAKNIRLTNREDETLLAITNEKSTKSIYSFEVGETYIGHSIVNNYLVLFTNKTESVYNEETDKNDTIKTDTIYRIDLDTEDLAKVILYQGDLLNLNPDNPIQAISDCESPLIQKVYWTDGLNPPRVINITKPELLEVSPSEKGTYNNIYKEAPFNFVQELDFNDTIEIVRSVNTSGIFPAGVIQYAFTYCNKYGQESNIFNTSELLYVAHADRGGSPEDTIGCSFTITLKNLDTKFDFVRIYSILRTTKDTTPTVKRIVDIPITYTTTENGTILTSPIEYGDNNTVGDTVDPTMLLYLGGKDIVADCIHSKDNTLFLGNIKYNRVSPSEVLGDILDDANKLNNFVIKEGTRTVELINNNPTTTGYSYTNQLSANTSTFKNGQTYRLGIQFQYKTGEWSEPIYLDNKKIEANRASISTVNNKEVMSLPIFNCEFGKSTDFKIIPKLQAAGYRKARAVIVLPENKDKEILAQGILCPTVFNAGSREDNSPHAQSSWFLRPFLGTGSGYLDPVTTETININNADEGSYVEYRHYKPLVSGLSRGAEIQNMFYSIPSGEGLEYDDKNIVTSYSRNLSELPTEDSMGYKALYFVDQSIVTFHSPDIEFNESIQGLINSSPSLKVKLIGYVPFIKNWGDIEVQTSTIQISPDASGFIHKSTSSNGQKSLVSGLFYQDAIVNDVGEEEGSLEEFGPLLSSEVMWLTHLWHRSGSLNNDSSRPADKGTRSAVLKKKIISNLKYSNDNTYLLEGLELPTSKIQVFNSNEQGLLKIFDDNNTKGDITYFGNVDGMNPSYEKFNIILSSINAEFNDVGNWTILNDSNRYNFNGKLFKIHPATFKYEEEDTTEVVIGHLYPALTLSKDPVRIKYKSTPHAVFALDYGSVEANVNDESYFFTYRKFLGGSDETVTGDLFWLKEGLNDSKAFIKHSLSSWVETQIGKPQQWKASLYLAEIIQEPINQFGGNSKDALESNIWIPAGPSVILDAASTVNVQWHWGDTWYQRYDCLKTYPYTQEDENQVIEIGSFMCETRVNIDGRYDRNRGQISNLYISPSNFNLINPVYSQKNNFFNYNILDEDFYKTVEFPNQILWSSTKIAGSQDDLWTNIHAASLLDLDGKYGKLNAIASFNDSLWAFQDSSVIRILFNSRVQVPVSDGVPIEITNNEKVSGTRIYSSVVGCQDKFTIKDTPYGIYFIDYNSNCIYRLSDALEPLSDAKGTSFWVKDNYTKELWTFRPKTNNSIRTYYDPKFKDVYFVPGAHIDENSAIEYKDAFCYSELLNEFTSTLSYGGAIMFPYRGRFYSLANAPGGNLTIWENFKGEDYNNIFGVSQSYYISFIANDNPTVTKIFDNLEFTADLFTSDGIIDDGLTHLSQVGKPFDFIQVNNEYQDTGLVDFNNNTLRKKFRIWRGIIPRQEDTRNRIRNPWANITLKSGNLHTEGFVLHDIAVKYTL